MYHAKQGDYKYSKVWWFAGAAAGVSELSINLCSCIACDIGEDVILHTPKFANEIYFWELVPHPKNCTARFVPRDSANPRSELPYARQIRVPFTLIYFLLCISPTRDRDVTVRLGSLQISHYTLIFDQLSTRQPRTRRSHR
jgi:hypothetical protein